MNPERRRTRGTTRPSHEALLDELRQSRTANEAARVTARSAVEQFGAIGAVVIDDSGPVEARPTRLDPLVLAELISVPEGVSVGPSGSPLAGMTIACFGRPEPDGIRIAAAWAAESSARVAELELAIDSLAAWLRQYAKPDCDQNRSVTGPGPQPEQFSMGREPLESRDFEQLIHTVPAIIYSAEMGESGRWHYVSPQIERILGYSPEEWVSDPTLWYRSIHPDDRDHALAFEDERLIGLDLHPPAEYRMLTRDNRYV